MPKTNLTYFRVPKTEKYTVISNYFLEDPNLSGTAKGVLAYILSCDRKKNDWILYKQELIKHFSDGKDSINSAFKNLEDNGYLITRREKKGRKTLLFFSVYEVPKELYELNFRTENPHTEEGQAKNCSRNFLNASQSITDLTSRSLSYADFQNDVSGISVSNPRLCAENPPVLNTLLNTSTNYCESASSSDFNNLRRVMKELNLSLSDDFYVNFKSFAESNDLSDDQAEEYLRWIYESKKKSAHNINSFIYSTACKANLLDEYLYSVQGKLNAEKKVYCKHCGKEQTFQEQREACCHGCGKDYFDFSQFANINAIQQ